MQTLVSASPPLATAAQATQSRNNALQRSPRLWIRRLTRSRGPTRTGPIAPRPAHRPPAPKRKQARVLCMQPQPTAPAALPVPRSRRPRPRLPAPLPFHHPHRRCVSERVGAGSSGSDLRRVNGPIGGCRLQPPPRGGDDACTCA